MPTTGGSNKLIPLMDEIHAMKSQLEIYIGIQLQHISNTRYCKLDSGASLEISDLQIWGVTKPEESACLTRTTQLEMSVTMHNSQTIHVGTVF